MIVCHKLSIYFNRSCIIFSYSDNFLQILQLTQRPYIAVKSNYRCMYKLNLIAIVSIVAAVSFVVGMTAPAAFAQESLTGNLTNTTNLNNTGSESGVGVNGSVSMNETLPTEGGSTLDMNMSNATGQ